MNLRLHRLLIYDVKRTTQIDGVQVCRSPKFTIILSIQQRPVPEFTLLLSKV